MFDSFLRARAESRGEPFVPFDAHDDYDEYVDGKQRLDGVRSLLTSRGITLPEGTPDDPPEAGIRRAVVSSSANCREVLEAAGIADLFEVRVDAIVAARERLRGKPAPDTFLAAAK